LPGLGAFLGHLYPVWLKFKGGKGVATYLGVLLGLAPLMVLVFAAVWLGMAKLFRFSSLAALAAAVAVPIALYVYGRPEIASLFVVMSVITILKAPPEHPPFDGRHRKPHRGQGLMTAGGEGRRGVVALPIASGSSGSG
jgi:glycerol-3-phosphate acyltransferase PlsY